MNVRYGYSTSVNECWIDAHSSKTLALSGEKKFVALSLSFTSNLCLRQRWDRKRLTKLYLKAIHNMTNILTAKTLMVSYEIKLLKAAVATTTISAWTTGAGREKITSSPIIMTLIDINCLWNCCSNSSAIAGKNIQWQKCQKNAYSRKPFTRNWALTWNINVHTLKSYPKGTGHW